MYKLVKALDRKTTEDTEDPAIIQKLGKLYRLDNLEVNTDLKMAELKSMLTEHDTGVKCLVNFGKVIDFEYGCAGLLIDTQETRLIFEDYDWKDKIFT